jgi:AbrB family looped-hinge helix DNA binding protein
MEEHVTMAPNGRLVIPAPVRAVLGMEHGGALVVRVEGGTIRLVPLRDVVSRVQAGVRRYIRAGTDLAAELARDRRREAEKE